ncbi:lysozyme inhibitor LprI family protein [Rheinheimera sp.]|uniref:lysozyme inhibitor LprI family protein n=1 Tax=Rheinheimera sp. TaxID=1869214 RepID=UPI0027325ECD|nr:lysozyme inhibitor LprI family protein [Rheinheimera sp.]MDP2713550.1 lysozyme inhibitor LprI family protein [Rheinheimera sp.]
MLLRPLLVLLLLFSVNSYAEATPTIDCTTAYSAQEVEHCALIALDKTEALLNASYHKLAEQLTQPDTEQDNYTEYRKKLLTAQRAWIKFRDADCDTQYAMHGSAPIGKAMYFTCQQQRAEQRIKQLDNYVPY